MSLNNQFDEIDDAMFEKLAQEKMNNQFKSLLNSLLSKLEKDGSSNIEKCMAGIEAGLVNILAVMESAKKEGILNEGKIVNSLSEMTKTFSNSVLELKSVLPSNNSEWEFKIERNSLSLIEKVIATRK